jgi:hypothetical protein
MAKYAHKFPETFVFYGKADRRLQRFQPVAEPQGVC